MITPNNVREAALKVEEENHRFRRFLKTHADEEELDQQFRSLHKELFASYDCSKCRNCCRFYDVSLENEEISTIAAAKGLTPDAFCKQFLSDGLLGYEIKKPCPFLREDGQCEVEFCKPSECAAYPYTDRLGRMGSLLNIIASAEVCPVVYEMLEQLKDTYHFRKQY